MNEAMKAMAARMAAKIRVIKISIDHYENRRNCPFFSELKGMEMALNTMGISFHYEYDDDINIIAVNVGGQRVEV